MPCRGCGAAIAIWRWSPTTPAFWWPWWRWKTWSRTWSERCAKASRHALPGRLADSPYDLQRLPVTKVLEGKDRWRAVPALLESDCGALAASSLGLSAWPDLLWQVRRITLARLCSVV